MVATGKYQHRKSAGHSGSAPSTVAPFRAQGNYTRLAWYVLVALLVVAIVLGLGLGAYYVSPGELWALLLQRMGISPGGIQPRTAAIIEFIRLPRVLFSIMAGAVLAISGAAIQGLFRNPLADPGLIGISSGASAAAVAAIVGASWLGIAISNMAGIFLVSIMAFGGAFLTTLLVYALSQQGGKTMVGIMLLAGVAIAAIAGAITGVFVLQATDAQLRSITFWSLGSLGGIGWVQCMVMLPIAILTVVGLMQQHRGLNALALGESAALHTGIRVERMKRIIILLVALGVGATVSMCGAIGFVGLVVPHALRMLMGASHRQLLPASALGGAVLLSLADTFCRTAIAPVEIPIGLATASLGAPFFLYLLIRYKKQMIL